MKPIKISYWICIFLFEGFSINPLYPASFAKADSIFFRGEYWNASIEYERVFFNAVDNYTRTIALINKSECLKAMAQIGLAEKCLLRINYNGLSDSLIHFSRVQTALCAYLAGNFTNAESQLLQLHNQVVDSLFIISSYPLYALVLNELKMWDKAKEVLLTYIRVNKDFGLNKDSLAKEIETAYSLEKLPKLINVNRAKLLSSILPGSGQIYSGYFWEGLANASLQGIAMASFAYGIYIGYYATAIVIGFGLLQKLYVGALTRTEYLANKRNYERVYIYNKKLKEIIMPISSSVNK